MAWPDIEELTARTQLLSKNVLKKFKGKCIAMVTVNGTTYLYCARCENRAEIVGMDAANKAVKEHKCKPKRKRPTTRRSKTKTAAS